MWHHVIFSFQTDQFLFFEEQLDQQGCQISSDPGKPFAKFCIFKDDIFIFWPKNNKKHQILTKKDKKNPKFTKELPKKTKTKPKPLR